MLHAMIMAGGGGTRFWPRSRQRRPKQFLKMSGDLTLIQQALERIEAQTAPEHCWVITGEAYSRGDRAASSRVCWPTTSSVNRPAATRLLASVSAPP